MKSQDSLHVNILLKCIFFDFLQNFRKYLLSLSFFIFIQVFETVLEQNFFVFSFHIQICLIVFI